MRQDLYKFIERHQLLCEGDTVIVATSGGPDSIALLHFLWSEKKRYDIEVKACHVDHQLRGSESDEDAHYVQRFCKERYIDLYEKKINVTQYAKEKKIGTQLAARELRYKWFTELLTRAPKSKIATGHHGDDQVETMFMKMVRGSVPIRPYGIPVQRKLGEGSLIRPFLGITKDDIEHYCKEESLWPRYDSSNDSLSYTRNRIRKRIIPAAKQENRHVHVHMQRQNEWANDDHTYLMTLAKEALQEMIVEKSERNVTISRLAFLSAAVPLQRRVIHLILSYLYGKNSPVISSIHIEQVFDLLYREKPSGEFDLSGLCFVWREYDVIHFSTAAKNRMPSADKKLEQVLPIPGKLQTNGWEIEAFVTDDDEFTEEPHQIVLNFEDITKPLVIRSRQASDKIACRGMDGTKKVGRLFIDRKISKNEREQWPLLVDGNGHVLWVPLLHRSRLSNAGPDTKKRLVVSCQRK